MANEYQQTEVIGSSYQRGRSLYFENPRAATPSLLVREERVTILADRVIAEPAGEIRKVVTDLSVAFPLRHPLTNDLIPGQQMTYEQLYVGLFSLYWHLAEERDAAAEPVSEPEPPLA